MRPGSPRAGARSPCWPPRRLPPPSTARPRSRSPSRAGSSSCPVSVPTAASSVAEYKLGPGPDSQSRRDALVAPRAPPPRSRRGSASSPARPDDLVKASGPERLQLPAFQWFRAGTHPGSSRAYRMRRRRSVGNRPAASRCYRRGGRAGDGRRALGPGAARCRRLPPPVEGFRDLVNRRAALPEVVSGPAARRSAVSVTRRPSLVMLPSSPEPPFSPNCRDHTSPALPVR